MAVGGGVGKLLIKIGLKSTVKADGKRVEKETGAIAKGIEKKGLMIGAGMTAVGVGAKLMADNINKSYLTFDSAMAEVKSLGGVTVEQMELMRTSAIGISKELPISAKEVAGGFYMMRSAGFDAARVLEELPAIAEMAVAGNLDMADAVNATTMVLDTYGERAGSAADITNVLMGTVQAFKTTLPELQMQLSKNIGVAASLGIEFGELAAMSGMLKKEFVSAEEAGTAMKTMLLRLVDPTVLAKIENMGIKVKDANGNFIGMLPILDGLSEKLDEAGGEVEQMAILQELFGTEGLRAAMSLIRQKDALKGYTDAVNSGVSVQEALNAVLESTQSQLDIANNKMEAAKITMGEAMAPATIFMAEAMAGFATVLEKIPGPLQTVIGSGMQLSQVFIGLGPLVMGLSVIYPAYATAQLSAATAGTTLTASIWATTVALLANPLLWIAVVIIAVVAALYLLEKKFEVITKVVGFFKDAFNGLKDRLFGVRDAAEETAEVSIDLAEAQEKVAESARKVDELRESYEELESAVKKVKGLTEDYEDTMRAREEANIALIEEQEKLAYMQAVQAHGEESAQAKSIKNAIEKAESQRDIEKQILRVAASQDRVSDAEEKGIEIKKKIGEATTELEGLMKKYRVTTIEELETIAKAQKISLDDMVALHQANIGEVERLEAEAEATKKDRLKRMTGFLREHYDEVLLGLPIIGQIIYAYKNWDEIATILSGVKEGVFEHFESLKPKFTEFYEMVKTTFTNVKTGIEEKLSTVLDTIKQPFIDAYDYITGLPETFKNAGKALIEALVNGIKAKKDAIIAEIKSAFGPFERFLTSSDAKEGPLSHLTDSGKAVWETFAAGMESARADLGSTFEKTLPTVTAKEAADAGAVSYGGNTISINSVNLSRDYDFEAFMKDIENYQQSKRVQRGINAI